MLLLASALLVHSSAGELVYQKGDIGDASLQSLDISPSARQCVGVLKAEVRNMNKDVKRRFEALLRETAVQTRKGHMGAESAKTMPLSTKSMRSRRHKPRAKAAPQRQIALSRSESRIVQKNLRQSFNRAVGAKKAASETSSKMQKKEQEIRAQQKQKAKQTANACKSDAAKCNKMCRKWGVRAIAKHGCTMRKVAAFLNTMAKVAKQHGMMGRIYGMVLRKTSGVFSETNNKFEKASRLQTAAKKELAKLKKKRDKFERGANSCSIELGSQVRVAAFDTGSPPNKTGSSLREGWGRRRSSRARSRGFCVLAHGQKVPGRKNSHLYCASSTLISRARDSYVTACTTKDKGRILVQNVVGKKVVIRDENGFKKTICMNYIKVAGCTANLNSGASKRTSKKRMCAENKVLLKCSVCTKGQTDCRKCSGNCAGARVSATMNV